MIDLFALAYFAAFVGHVIDWRLLSLPSLPTGGDMASHVLYAWLVSSEWLPAGRLTAWMPEVFAGFPAISYYFPLPFVVTALLAKFVGFAAGAKWATMLPSFCFPASRSSWSDADCGCTTSRHWPPGSRHCRACCRRRTRSGAATC